MGILMEDTGGITCHCYSLGGLHKNVNIWEEFNDMQCHWKMVGGIHEQRHTLTRLVVHD
jgi:hypothetical protein